MSRRATLRLLLLGLLLCWCGVFLRSENTEKSIVRALLLEQTPEQWNVALLYQFPEAAADSSDAAASVQLCAGTGETLEQAVDYAKSIYGTDDIIWYNEQGGRRPHAAASYAMLSGDRSAALPNPYTAADVDAAA